MPVGVVNLLTGDETLRTLTSLEKSGGDIIAKEVLSEVKNAEEEAAMVLAACHSLVVIDDTNDVEEDEEGEEVEGNNSGSPTTPAASSSGAGGSHTPATTPTTPPLAAKPTPAKQGPQLVGDPIELASIQGVEWTWDAVSSTASPGAWTPLEKKLAILYAKLAEVTTAANASAASARTDPTRMAPPPPPQLLNTESQLAVLQKQITDLDKKIKEAKAKASKLKCRKVQVIQRHYFSSSLQRMSVVCKVSFESSLKIKDSWYCLIKGSPEAIKSLLEPTAIPSWYDECYGSLARRGLRVLALAYRSVDSKQLESLPKDLTPATMPREWVESNLTFCGFIAFECKIRADSPIVISALKESDHSVFMLTGDSPLTSIHVAREVNICSKRMPIAVLKTSPPGSSSSSSLSTYKPSLETINAKWVSRNDDGTDCIIPFTVGTDTEGSVKSMVKKFDLITTETDFLIVADAMSGKNFSKAILEGNLELDEILSSSSSSFSSSRSIWHDVEHFRVFARMSPQGKRYIISAIQKIGKIYGAHVLMCGDGGNDVGALKQADVGIALLAGHANANTTERLASSSTTDNASSSSSSSSLVQGTTPSPASAEDALNAHDTALKERAAAVNKMREAHMKVFQANYQKKQQEDLKRDLQKLTEKGELMGAFTYMKEQAVKARNAMQAENARFMAMHGQIWDPKSEDQQSQKQSDLFSMFGIDPSAADASGDPMGGSGPPMVRPGDASVAAPFTSRVPSVRAVVDLIRQGRCTLLSALMQQQIMMLESTIAAYTLSALSLHNARSSERQMMASSWLIMTAAVAFSYASPVDKMHPQRPLSSLFHPAIIISILGQAAIHIACMTLAVNWATEAMGPELLLEVTEFFKKAKAKQIDQSALCDEDDYMCNFNLLWSAPFMPNLLNSVVFLVETSQMISVFFANYKGRPWMKGMLENHPLFLSVFLCIAGVVVASWEMIPQLNELIQLAPFPGNLVSLYFSHYFLLKLKI